MGRSDLGNVVAQQLGAGINRHGIGDPVEQRAIADVLTLRSEGLSIRAIVAAMNARGVPTRDGGRWHIATVQRVLRRARAGA